MKTARIVSYDTGPKSHTYTWDDQNALTSRVSEDRFEVLASIVRIVQLYIAHVGEKPDRDTLRNLLSSIKWRDTSETATSMFQHLAGINFQSVVRPFSEIQVAQNLAIIYAVALDNWTFLRYFHQKHKPLQSLWLKRQEFQYASYWGEGLFVIRTEEVYHVVELDGSKYSIVSPRCCEFDTLLKVSLTAASEVLRSRRHLNEIFTSHQPRQRDLDVLGFNRANGTMLIGPQPRMRGTKYNPSHIVSTSTHQFVIKKWRVAERVAKISGDRLHDPYLRIQGEKFLFTTKRRVYDHHGFPMYEFRNMNLDTDMSPVILPEKGNFISDGLKLSLFGDLNLINNLLTGNNLRIPNFNNYNWLLSDSDKDFEGRLKTATCNTGLDNIKAVPILTAAARRMAGMCPTSQVEAASWRDTAGELLIADEVESVFCDY